MRDDRTGPNSTEGARVRRSAPVLSSDLSPYVTGQIVVFDGGWTI